MEWAKCVFWMYTFLINDIEEARRQRLETQLESVGIETRPIFYPVSKLPPYQSYEVSNPISLSLSSKGLSLPTYEELEETDIDFIASSVERFLKSN